MGIPAGFLADMYGRRSSLVLCFIAYVLSFVGFASASSLPVLFVTMFSFAVGESFRSGTHKAMVFHHLRLTGREAEKAMVYGFTRSWSKAGSALSSLLSGLLVFLTGSYAQIFLFSIPPYLLNTVNVALYPKALEGEGHREHFGAREALVTMWRETKACAENPVLRGLFVESAVLQALAKTVKEYVQPLVVTALAGIATGGFLGTVEPTKRSALLLGGLYFVLNAGAATAARNAHRFDEIDSRPFPWLWSAVMLVGVLLTTGAALRGVSSIATVVAVTGFILLVLLENLWRPLFLDRLDDVSDSRYGAAVLSVEAQFASIGIMLLAPLVGKTADHFGLGGIGLLVCALGLLTALVSLRRKRRALRVSTP
jgi:MFS family permease